MSKDKKPPRRAKELQSAVRESVDFKGKQIDRNVAAQKLAAARKWLRLPLREFLEQMGISESDHAYDQIVAIWRDFPD